VARRRGRARLLRRPRRGTAADRPAALAGAATVVGPALVAAAVCFEEGLFTTNGLNAVAVAVLLALLGGALGVATARAIRLRERGTLESTPAERERGS
jgi:hypothetical protein